MDQGETFPIPFLNKSLQTFLMNIVDINDRVIRTALEKQKKVAGVMSEGDKRGKHGKQTTLDPQIKKGLKSSHQFDF